MLPLHILNIRIAPTPTTHPILLLDIPFSPIIVLLLPAIPPLLQHGDAKSRTFLGVVARPVVRDVRILARGGVGGAVLDGGVAVADVAEVVDGAGREEGAGGEGVDGGVAPLGLH